MDREVALNQIREEYSKACKNFKPFNGKHEGYAVILEEFDELWDEIKKHDPNFDFSEGREEAIQVGAMVLRFLTDCC